MASLITLMPKKYHSKPHDHGAILPDLLLLGDKQYTEANTYHQHCSLGYLERHNLGSNGGTYIGAYYDADGLGHGHQACCHKAND